MSYICTPQVNQNIKNIKLHIVTDIKISVATSLTVIGTDQEKRRQVDVEGNPTLATHHVSTGT